MFQSYATLLQKEEIIEKLFHRCQALVVNFSGANNHQGQVDVRSSQNQQPL